MSLACFMRLLPLHMRELLTAAQVHEEFAYGVSEQLLRSRAADQVCHARPMLSFISSPQCSLISPPGVREGSSNSV